jgi:tRNA (guanine10-N2)-methyltransferase
LLYAAAHWGAYVVGSDIDGRQIRGKGESARQRREVARGGADAVIPFSANADPGLLVAKGKETVPGVFRAAEQYGLSNQFLDCLVYDVTQSPLRRGGWIDAIITDPPCEWNGTERRMAEAAGWRIVVLMSSRRWREGRSQADGEREKP